MRAHSTIDHHQPHHLGRMPRPAKKKPGTRTTLAKEYDDHTSRRQVQGQNRRRGAFRGESPDKRAVRSTHHSTENFERRCLDVFESMKDEIESKFKSHEAHLAQLYRSVEEINDEVESPETELSFERMVQEDFDTEVRNERLGLDFRSELERFIITSRSKQIRIVLRKKEEEKKKEIYPEL